MQWESYEHLKRVVDMAFSMKRHRGDRKFLATQEQVVFLCNIGMELDAAMQVTRSEATHLLTEWKNRSKAKQKQHEERREMIFSDKRFCDCCHCQGHPVEEHKPEGAK